MHIDRTTVMIVVYTCLNLSCQVCLNPDSLGKLAKGQPMRDVFLTFNASSGRSYLKSFVYSRLKLNYWSKLYEIEEYYSTKVLSKKFRYL
uniref:Secreted protein n=1 Tax=Strongyloides venezuelensis TaxID=75913 RepID=A0A0K0FYE5_STRVS